MYKRQPGTRGHLDFVRPAHPIVTRPPARCLRGSGFGVEPGELFDVESSVAVAVEVPEQERDARRREVERRTLQNVGRLLQSDVAVAVDVVLLELGNQLRLAVDTRTPPSLPNQGPDLQNISRFIVRLS